MKKLSFFLLVFSCALHYVRPQLNTLGLENIPQEKVYLHTNTNFVFTGEYLYYQLYNLLPKSEELSSISKIGYVDLINEGGIPVFQHKLILRDGVASSEFFVPADVPSGNYKLVGYTNWIKNFPNSLFTKDITILNPYLGDQKVFLSDSTISNTSFSYMTRKVPKNTNTNAVSISMLRSTFGKREKVEISLEAKSIQALAGTYSLSVRKSEPFPTAENLEMKDIILGTNEISKIQSYKYLPETKGTLISGKLENEPGDAIAIQRVMLSFPGENSVFQIATTDSTGIFKTQLLKNYKGDKVLVRYLGMGVEPSDIKLDTERQIDYDIEGFYKFLLDEKMKEYIIERSIHNQIENAYFEIKPDSILPLKTIEPFYAGQMTTYRLDDYTRFSSLKETFVEILENVWIDENTEGNPVFKVRYFQPLQDSGEPPLVFLDGAYIHNHEKLLGLPSKSIQSIKIGRDQYLYGSYSFQGIIDINTFEGNTYDQYLDMGTEQFSFEGPRIKKNYYKEDYSNNLFSEKIRVPDFRNQLLWLPEIHPKTEEFKIHFYTSDVSGDYEIVLEGITNSGLPITVRKYFSVL